MKKEKKEEKTKTPYFYYCQEMKEKWMKEDESTWRNEWWLDLSKSDLTKKCQEGWKKLTAEEKKSYVEKSAGEKESKKAQALEDEKMKKPKAPSAYLLYCGAHREEIKKKNPGRKWREKWMIDATPTEIMKKLGEAWKVASEKEKKKYEEEAKKKKEEVEKQIKDMEANGVVFKGKTEKKTLVTEENVFNSAEWLFIEEKMGEYLKEHAGRISGGKSLVDSTRVAAKRELKQEFEALSVNDKFEYEKKRFKRMETFFEN